MNTSSNPNLRHGSKPPSVHSHASRNTATHIPPMSQFGGFPQLPFMPFGGGPGSAAGSDYGGHVPMPPMGYQNTGSAFGMMPSDPRNTMMTNLNMFGGGSGSQVGGVPSPLGAVQRPMSGYSMATTTNMFAGPSMNPNPTDDDLVNALRNYLSTQDLMTVTKK
jgi:chitin synthase